MRVLFDQNVAKDLKPFLAGHEVRTSRQMGWPRFANGELLRAAEEGGFDVFVTGDRNLRYQQNLTMRLIAILELTRTNWPMVKPHAAEIAAAVGRALPGSYQVIDCGRPGKRFVSAAEGQG